MRDGLPGVVLLVVSFPTNRVNGSLDFNVWMTQYTDDHPDIVTRV